MPKENRYANIQKSEGISDRFRVFSKVVGYIWDISEKGYLTIF